jgi:hypothetical protein
MEVAGRRVWVLVEQTPGDRKAVFLANYWAIAAAVLDRYEPAAIAGLCGVNLHLGNFTPPEHLRVYHDSSKSQYKIVLEPGFDCQLQPRDLAEEGVVAVGGPGRSSVPVLRPAELLLTLDEPEILLGVEQVVAWLRNLTLRTPDIDRVLRDNRRPVVTQRLADIAMQAGNAGLAKQLDAAARRVSSTSAQPARTGVGTRIQVPQVFGARRVGTAKPWLDEQLMRLDRQLGDVARIVGDPRHTRVPESRLLAHARGAKVFDAYHSTTMEGYRIAPEVVESIVRGEASGGGPRDEQSLAAALAVQGYSRAFDLVLERARRRTPITQSLILDLHEALHRPAVDAGIVEASDLRVWRTIRVGLKGWQHVPPNHVKLPDLMDEFEAFASRTDITDIQRALLVQLEFVTIHPFFDGNGRLGRLLTNHALLSAGWPWITVPSDERLPFFRAMEEAQVSGGTDRFISFLWRHIKQANADIANAARRRRRGSR